MSDRDRKSNEKQGKASKSGFNPKPQPGKFRPVVKTTFSPGTSCEPTSVQISGVPRVAQLLYNVGVKQLEEIVEDGEPIDLEPADVVFAGEIAVAVAAAKNGSSELSNKISKISAYVPEPLFDIADAIGKVEDDLGQCRSVKNADALARSHFIAAASTYLKFADSEEIEKISLETADFKEYPDKEPKFLVPKEYLDKKALEQAVTVVSRVTSPAFQKRQRASRWVDDLKKYLKDKKDEATFMGWLSNLDEKNLVDGEVQKALEEMSAIMLKEKYMTTRAYARSATGRYYNGLGIFLLETMFKHVDVQAKRTARSIGKLFDHVVPAKKTKRLSRDGSIAWMIHADKDHNLFCHHKVDDDMLSLAFVAQFSVKPEPRQSKYTVLQGWEEFATKWIKSYLRNEELDSD